MPVTLATWNINSVRLRMPLVVRFVKAHQPDILCLQEIKCLAEQFPRRKFINAGYPYQAVHGQKGYHGVAIVSKFPLTEVVSRPFCEIPDSRHISARVDFGAGPVTVHNFYVPAGGDEPDPERNWKFRHKLDFVAEMHGWFADPQFATGQIICGDFNIAPYENDVWSHRQLLRIVSHTPVETQALVALLEGNHGWVDLVRKHVPVSEKLYSWWSYRAPDWRAADKGRRLDHIWATADVAAHCGGAEVFKAFRGITRRPSDHVPVVARFDVDVPGQMLAAQ